MKLRQIREAQKRKNKNNISQMRERLCRLTYLYADGPQVAMANRDTSVADLCEELGVKPVTLYRYVDPNGNLRGYGKRVLSP